MSEFTVAERFFQRALAINRAQRNLKEIATNLNNLCLYRGNTEEKLSFIQEAITINKNLDAQWSLGENYNNMGKQYYYGKQYSNALEALRKAYEYAHNIGARELICDNYEYSSMVYAAIGDYAQAYKYRGTTWARNCKVATSYATSSRKFPIKDTKTKNMLLKCRNKPTR